MENGFNLNGWYDFFETAHPEAFAKYKTIYKELNALFGKTDSESMERFKDVCKAFEQAYQWALDKYVGFLKEKELKGTQTTLI